MTTRRSSTWRRHRWSGTGRLWPGSPTTPSGAVQRSEALRPDVVLVDIRLGEESGFEAARKLAGNGHSAALMMISTHAGADYADLIAESPAAGFLAKAELSAAAIRQILGTA